VFQKSDAKIEITVTMTNLIRIKYPLCNFNYRLSGANVTNFNKINHTVSEQQLCKKWNSKIELSNMEKSPKQFVHNNISYRLCSKWPRLHGYMRIVEHATVKLLGQWRSGRSNATPRWDAVSSGRRHESCYGRRVAGARSTPHSPRDLGQGCWAATATVRWNMVCCETKTPRCHQLSQLEHCPVGKWKSLLLWN